MIQSVSFTSAAFEAFAEAYLCFLVSASAKKENNNAEAIKFLEILKKYVCQNKIYFCLKKKRAIFCLIKSYFCFSHKFQT